jgi:hypothetical protein
MKSGIAVHILVAVVLTSLSASAESSSTLSSARELAKLGLQAYDAGKYQEAAEKLANAYRVVRVPTLAVIQARALVKLGKWVSASELYLEAMHIPKDKSWQSIQTDAQREAEMERAELLPRIPRIKIALQGATDGEVAVAVDGTTIPTALLSAEQMLDPGTRIVRGTRGTEIVTQNITVKAGERTTVTLRFAEGGMPAPPAVATPNQPKNAEPATPPRSGEPGTRRTGGNTQKTLGWIGIGLGGAGLVAGGVTGIVALSKRSTLRDSGSCSSDMKHCDPELGTTVNAYNTMRTVSAVGFFAGGILAAAGVTLLLTSPKQESAPLVGLWLGPSGATLVGGF